MKITKQQLRQVIKEELKNIDETWGEHGPDVLGQRIGTEREGQPLNDLEQLKMALKDVDPGSA